MKSFHEGYSTLIPVMAAAVASVGDLLMLSVAYGADWINPGDAAGLSTSTLVLWIGGVAGLAIPLYFLGYKQAIVLLDGRNPRARRIILFSGAGTALFGAITHGLTAIDIQTSRTLGVAPRAPNEAFMPAVEPLFVFGALAVLSALLASSVFSWAAWRSSSARARWPAILNPVLVTTLLVIVSSAAGVLQNYLAPVTPNLSHVLFFLVCHVSAVSARSMTG